MIDLLWCSLATFFPKPMSAVKKVPRVLVFIPDGNRRWAKSLGKVGSFGHDQGVIRCIENIQAAFQYGIRHVVFWGASYSNLVERPDEEVSHLVSLVKRELQRRITDDDREQTRFRLIGHWREISWIDKELKDLVNQVEKLTARWTEKQFTILFGYDFRMDMEDAIGNLQKSYPNFDSIPRPAREAAVAKTLSTGFLGDVDFIIRTGSKADPHWSASFLGWNVGNAQLAFLNTPWPMFRVNQLNKALRDYSNRKRRMGA